MSGKYTISLPVFDTCLSCTGLYEITSVSNQSEKQALEQLAKYFKSEMRYDNIQYDSNNHDIDCIGFLFTENAMDIYTEDHTEMPTRCVGGCCFRKIDEIWVLCWIWLHPFIRNSGLLSNQWGFFNSKFGDFAIEAPVSPSMNSFLSKNAGVHSLVKI